MIFGAKIQMQVYDIANHEKVVNVFLHFTLGMQISFIESANAILTIFWHDYGRQKASIVPMNNQVISIHLPLNAVESTISNLTISGVSERKNWYILELMLQPYLW